MRRFLILRHLAPVYLALALPFANLAIGADPSPSPTYLEGVPLIARDALFGNPQRAAVRISPDGRSLSWLAPVDGVMNVWTAPRDDLGAARAVTKDARRGIRQYSWAYDNRRLIYLQDAAGDENWHVYRVDVESGETLDLTPIDGVNARIAALSHRQPNFILVELNERSPQAHDLYRIDLSTGERIMIEKNEAGFLGYEIDDDLAPRLATRMAPDGGKEVLRRDPSGEWQSIDAIAADDTLTTAILGFDKPGERIYLMDSRERNTGALFSVNLKTGERKLLVEDERADVGQGVLLHPTENTVQAVPVTVAKREWRVLDAKVQADFKRLAKVAAGEIEITSRSLDDRWWVVAFLIDDGPTKYYLYDRTEKQERFLFSNRDDLDGLPLVKMHPVTIPSRDDFELTCYLSLPPGTDPDGDGRPNAPLPLVLNVHGGPWSRDFWGYDAEHQWLANRGYACLSVNFRGSTGFGKEFVNAGNREWAGKMHDDLLDAVYWSVKQKIADVHRIGIMGGSYGGYATLVGLSLTPDVFACGVDIVGPSNILTLLNTIPPYWTPMVQMFKDRVGDYTSEEGQKFLASRSPLSHVANIRKPLLIGQGANDPRVKQAESDQIVAAMQARKIPVTYVLYSDEGHGFARPENRQSFYAVAEAFLAPHLGGRFEPIGDDFSNSSIAVPAGAEQIPGLAESLPR